MDHQPGLEAGASYPNEMAITALEHGRRGRSCSEAIMLAFCQRMALNPSMAVKLASGLGGGVGLSGHICGAALAGCLVIGACQGAVDPSQSYQRQQTYLLIQEYLECFQKSFGSSMCQDLCFARLGPGQGMAQVRQLDLVEQIIATSAKQLDELLKREEGDAQGRD